MTRHLAKLFDAIWTLSMGLFLGLTGGLVLSVILTFNRTKKMNASPGIEPFSDPRFAEYHHDAVAGAIGQDLFFFGGIAALALFALAILARLGHSIVTILHHDNLVGNKKTTAVRGTLLCICAALLLVSAKNTRSMNTSWPGLYDTDANQDELATRREAFDHAHKRSERITASAWLCGFVALSLSPWCRRIADKPTNESTKAQPQ